MRALIAIDGSPASQSVVDEVAARPWPKQTALHVLSVLDSLLFTKSPVLVRTATKGAQAAVDKAAEQLRSTKMEVSASVVEGNPASSIVDVAAKWKADFVIVGSHGAGRLGRFLLGSTAHAVVRKAPCSVEIVRRAARDQKGGCAQGLRILLATDGSDYSTAAVQSVAQRSWPQGTEVRVIAVPEFIVPTLETTYVSPEFWEKLRANSISDAKAAVAAALKILKGTRLKAEGDVPTALDVPKAVILDEAKNWNARLIVVGSHGRRGFDRFVMGSVSEAVAMHAHCSVEVIRPRQAPKGKGETK